MTDSTTNPTLAREAYVAALDALAEAETLEEADAANAVARAAREAYVEALDAHALT